MFAEEFWDGYQASQSKISRNQINRDRLGAQNRFVATYFCENPMYDDRKFQGSFPNEPKIIHTNCSKVTDHSSYFQQNSSCAVTLDSFPLTKCTSSIRQLAYGVNPDALDEYLQMNATTIREYLQKICEVIMDLYGKYFLRKPTVTDIEKLYVHHYENREFPGMIKSIDCTD